MQNAEKQTKLRTFIEIFDKLDYKGIAYTGLSRRQRSLVIKFKIGIMPLSIETGRYTDVPLENRLCINCSDGLLEDEYHLLLYCDAYKPIRDRLFKEYTFIHDVDDPTDRVELVRLMLNSHNLRGTAKYLEEMFDTRQKLIYI